MKRKKFGHFVLGRLQKSSWKHETEPSVWGSLHCVVGQIWKFDLVRFVLAAVTVAAVADLFSGPFQV